MGNPELPAYGAGASTLAMAIVFGAITVTTAAMTMQSWLVHDSRVFNVSSNPKSSPLQMTYVSIYTLLRQCTVFGFILFFAYICEYHPPFPHAEKYYDRDEFFMLTGLLFFASAFTIHKNDGKLETDNEVGKERNGTVAKTSAANDILNRDQTEEWKGWMQFMFLLYHYFHAEEVYNSIRIMITCYVWMTGFGNFSFFYLKSDFSLVRVLQMLWRLNFLVIFLCLTQGTTYILYYICPLHTYFFFMVYVAMRVGKEWNYTKYGLRYKLMALGVCIYAIWDLSQLSLFSYLHFFLPTTPQLGAGNGTLWEWYFRTTLDHWSTFLGMIFAANFPIMSYLQRKIEAQPARQEWLAKGSIGVCLFAVFVWWATNPFLEPKLSYNLTNAYYGFIPLITYIYFRNLTPTLRSYSLDLLHQIGKTTLETYLMQHHIWLTSNAKSLLTLVPGWPKVNFLLVTMIYFFVSRRLYRITLFLRGMLMPDDHVKCLKSLAIMGIVIGASYMYALALELLGINSLATVFISSLVIGAITYQWVTSKTYPLHIQQYSLNCNAKSSEPLLTGAGVLMTIGIIWHVMAIYGAGKVEALPSSCSSYANNGKWVPLTTCNELQNGIGSYEYNVGSYATCYGQNWGWEKAPSNTLCRFNTRSSKALQQQAKGNRVVFIGDSMTRKLFHAFSRSLGEVDAGAFDTSVEKHSDFKNTIGKVDVEFYWAPYAGDEVDKLRQIRSSKPDLVVVGGGSWDRLHHWPIPEDKQAHMDSLVNLSNELNQYKLSGMSIVWLVPTTINDGALTTDEKRENINETQMEIIRNLYSSKGILDSVSFVLDGPSFTKQRVSESFDGVHYPNSIYDAGGQILANALDWLVQPKSTPPSEPPHPGKMSQPVLGLMMLVLSFIALMYFDSYFGLSYLPSLFVDQVKPNYLYEEAFGPLHEAMKLPPIGYNQVIKHDETDGLLKTNGDVEMSQQQFSMNKS